MKFINWPISIKMMAVQSIIVLISLIIVISYVGKTTKKTTLDSIGRDFEQKAININNWLVEVYADRSDYLSILSVSPELQKQVINFNNSYVGSRESIIKELRTKNIKWMNSEINDPFVEKTLSMDKKTNNIGHIIHDFTNRYEVFGEFIITDKYGATIYASRKIDNYYHGDETWFQETWNEGEGNLHYSNPELRNEDGTYNINISIPIYNFEGEPIGVIYGKNNLTFDGIVNIFKFENTGHAHIINRNSECLDGRDSCEIINKIEHIRKLKDDTGALIHSGYIIMGTGKNQSIIGYNHVSPNFNYVGSNYLNSHFLETIENLDYTILVTQSMNEVLAVHNQNNKSILFAGIIAILAIIIVSYIFIRWLLKPLIQIINQGYLVARGNLNIKFSEKLGTDEVGRLNQMFNELIHYFKKTAEAAGEIAKGNLDVNVTPISEEDEMGKALEIMVNNLRDQIGEINQVVNLLTTTNNQIMTSISQLSSSTTETATTVNEITTTIEEVMQTAELTSQKVKNVSETAQKSVQISQEGTQATEDSIEGMNNIQEQVKLIADTVIKLSEQNQAISEITTTVKDIAEQSNLLAVNASIEAVKAGEYGKGFGVVAHEIRTLADQSKESTKQIRQILNDVQKAISSAVMATEQGGKAVEQGVSLAETASDAIAMLEENISEAAQSSTQIAASNQQQLVGMEQLATALENIKQATNQNAAGTKESERALHNLTSIVENLTNLIERYSL